MSKNIVTIIIIILIYIVPTSVFCLPTDSLLLKERRKVENFPNIPNNLKMSSLHRFFSSFDKFFIDRFPLRSILVMLPNKIRVIFKDKIYSLECYEGKDNWLFYGDLNSYGLEKLIGIRVLTNERIIRLAGRYKAYNDLAKDIGSEFIFFLGPNKSNIYNEYLPEIFIPLKKRYIIPFLEYLSNNNITVYDPTDKIIKSKSIGLLYYRTDSHWNSKGAYKAFDGFCEFLSLPKLPTPSFLDVGPYRGDLVDLAGLDEFPLSNGDHFSIEWSTSPHVIEENGKTLNLNPLSDKQVWVFGDSFAEALKPYFNAMFREVHYIRYENYESSIYSLKNKPDLIIWIEVERNII
jgi:hypothetical protein